MTDPDPASGSASGAGAAPGPAAIEAVWRLEAPKLIAALVRVTRDVDEAEDLAQDALVAALEQWPRSGLPREPGAWLMTVAKRRSVDQIRRRTTFEAKQALLVRELEETEGTVGSDIAAAADPDRIGDDLLRLMFLACHPALSSDSQVALTLRLLGGLTTDEIARALLANQATVGQRLSRAKKTLAAHRAAFDDPDAAERAERIPAVLAVVYLIFNEGYSATSGDQWSRPDLCLEALRLGRVLAGLLPRDTEVLGLLALMDFQASRLAARLDVDGRPVLLLDQNRRRWDRLLIRHGLRAMDRARALPGTPGPYLLQAELAACHSRAVLADDTDWARIAGLYAQLGRIQPSPVVELNRAVAVGHVNGPAAALEIVEAVAADPTMARYHLLPAVRADLLIRLGRRADARGELLRAAELAGNAFEREMLLRRAEALAG